MLYTAAARSKAGFILSQRLVDWFSYAMKQNSIVHFRCYRHQTDAPVVGHELEVSFLGQRNDDAGGPLFRRMKFVEYKLTNEVDLQEICRHLSRPAVIA